VIHVQRGAHEREVTGLEWVQGQPLLISSSPDNSVKVSRMLWGYHECLLTLLCLSNGYSIRRLRYRGCSSSEEDTMLLPP
jgi:hypothetical protein